MEGEQGREGTTKLDEKFHDAVAWLGAKIWFLEASRTPKSP